MNKSFTRFFPTRRIAARYAALGVAVAPMASFAALDPAVETALETAALTVGAAGGLVLLIILAAKLFKWIRIAF